MGGLYHDIDQAIYTYSADLHKFEFVGYSALYRENVLLDPSLLGSIPGHPILKTNIELITNHYQRE